MKTLGRFAVGMAILSGGLAGVVAAETPAPKKILVVSTSTRNHYPAAVAAAEKALIRLAEQSHAFTLEFVRQPDVPEPVKPAAGADLSTGVDAQAQATYDAAKKRLADETAQSLQRLSPAALKDVDAVIFSFTTGDLPLPDKDGFMEWIKAGHAFIGYCSAHETMNTYPPYYEMLGGRWTHFKGTKEWADLDVINQNPAHLANQGIPAHWPIREFNYKVPNFVLSDPAHTTELLALDKSPTNQTPGHFPLAWCREYGHGRVFYTALGGNGDLWDPNVMPRKNPPETAKIFLAHLLDGIRWTLRQDAEPPAK